MNALNVIKTGLCLGGALVALALSGPAAAADRDALQRWSKSTVVTPELIGSDGRWGRKPAMGRRGRWGGFMPGHSGRWGR